MGKVKVLWSLPKPFVCSYNKKLFKEEYIIENKDKRINFTDSQIAIKHQPHEKSKQGKTMIIIKEHFNENGKSLEEILTDVIIQKARKIAV